MGDYAARVRALSIANMKVNLPFLQVLMRGIVCNWLVCLAVWLANSSDTVTGKMLSCLFPIMAFVAIGFEHSIANMYFIPMVIFLKGVLEVMARFREPITNLTWEGFLYNNFLLVTEAVFSWSTLLVCILKEMIIEDENSYLPNLFNFQ
jgi:formate/nitrite transporter FocA (FNT family)